MEKIRIGIVGASEIAYRRFLPALKKHSGFEYVGVGISRVEDEEKAKLFKKDFGGEIYNSYEKIIYNPNVDAIYIPQPPALHFKYAEMALNAGKHVLLEKPFTTRYADSKKLIELARQLHLAIHENYMFQYHRQIDFVKKVIASKELGEIREYRLCFGFPHRQNEDFRYKKSLGGGALLDCGGYPIYLANILLGGNAFVDYCSLRNDEHHEVDLFGTVILRNESNQIAYVGFGMDNAYQCNLFIWGSKGTLNTNRIFTAPDGIETRFEFKIGNDSFEKVVEPDDSFLKSIDFFHTCIFDKEKRKINQEKILKQAYLIERCLEGAK